MKTIILGFDAFDPIIFERLVDQGKLPNLATFLEKGTYSRLSVANPAQSEVSWTSIATGLDAGGHGLFDFVHRNPANYSLHVSLLPTKKQLFGIQFTQPHSAETVFNYAVQQGYPATTLWWPATFPARLSSPVRSIPGLGTPDILGRLGVGSFYSVDPSLDQEEYKTKVSTLEVDTQGRYKGILQGPVRKKRKSSQASSIEFKFELKGDDRAVLYLIDQKVDLSKGEWSPFLHVSFKMGLGVSVRAITRAVYNDGPGGVGLFFLPLQIHPLHALWPYASPHSFINQVWKAHGPFLTLGWPQDTTSLEEGFIDDDQFLDLCESIVKFREQVFMDQLRSFQEGILAVVFDSLDRIQHMFWRDRPDIIEKWYLRLDALFGRVMDQVRKKGSTDCRIVVVSDHGFTNFDHKVHLNRWLIENGFLQAKSETDRRGLSNVDWNHTRAYALGLSSIYVNLAEREGQGIVTEPEKNVLLNEIKGHLLEWDGPSGQKVVSNVWLREEAFHGPLVDHGPDLVIGFNSGFRASPQTGLGGWEDRALEPNHDHWGADHCIDPNLVPGVVMANVDLGKTSGVSFRDLPKLIVGEAVDEFRPSSGEGSEFVDEDEKILEERLKDLGYL
jgi:predicted AlkP superfamily phosphohydrolase/phosphomutase